ncbi:DNA fragmentation factor subunit beta-like [Chionomys nivalis]|uniref:DNA fragmentation factor subunit beta-like n=1 Tax=Chionomys nivalis TaxID=269649 RepID=UPI00259AA8BA|nr:DNA fragmentation factor subunit beta-like [Chionomys nivalis]
MHAVEDKSGLEPDSRQESRDALPRGLKQAAATSLHCQKSSSSVPAEDRARAGSPGAAETSRRDAAVMPVSTRFGGASPLSGRPHPGPLRRGPLRRGQRRSGGLPSRFRSKSSYLRSCCKQRIHGYIKEVHARASVMNRVAQKELKRVLTSMCRKLKSKKYNSSYFDRKAKASDRLCNLEGWFTCQGPFDLEMCLYKHYINPYSKRESRLLFSTWNLDHIIERRIVVRTLLKAVQQRRKINCAYFYNLLFTSDNLKLVHIACHKKTAHKLQCDHNKIYRPLARSKKQSPSREERPVCRKLLQEQHLG